MSRNTSIKKNLIICLLMTVLLAAWFLPCIAEEAAVSAPDISEKAYPDAIEGFLPVCHGARTGKKVVALTFDDCNEAENLRTIIDLISENNGTATIFPIGENVYFLAPILRSAVSLGFEIENHTMSHSGLYSEDDEGLAYQIWQQNREVCLALGVDYQMHFLRPMGGDNRYDQRTHNYMRQMGYSGIAYWAQVGSNNTASQIMKDLQPGQIILFHTTAEDLRIVKSLVPKLVAKGYKMVTMNELFGLEPNAQTELTENAAPFPLELFTRFEQTLKRGDWLHDVKLMQDKLTELGYLNDKCDGKFGEVTKAALKEFQAEHGLDPTGVCDPATWDLLFR